MAHLLQQLKTFCVPVLGVDEEKKDKAGNYYELVDVCNEHSLLEVSTDKIHISGGTDAVIVPCGMTVNKQEQLCCIFEFKTNLSSANAFPHQVEVEAIAAQMLSKQPVLTISTDLRSSHAFGMIFDKHEGDTSVKKTPLLFDSLSAMAEYVKTFLESNCVPWAVMKRKHSAGGDSGDSETRRGVGGGDGGGDRDGGGGGGGKSSKLLMLDSMNEHVMGTLTLAHEHFYDHIDDTEVLSSDRKTMINDFMQSYGFTVPSYKFRKVSAAPTSYSNTFPHTLTDQQEPFATDTNPSCPVV